VRDSPHDTADSAPHQLHNFSSDRTHPSDNGASCGQERLGQIRPATSTSSISSTSSTSSTSTRPIPIPVRTTHNSTTKSPHKVRHRSFHATRPRATSAFQSFSQHVCTRKYQYLCTGNEPEQKVPIAPSRWGKEREREGERDGGGLAWTPRDRR
jgi:hypothetical protein